MFKNTVNQFTKKLISIILSAAVMVLLLGTTTNPTHAATITVTSLNNSGTGTLRAAIAAAGSGDTINFSVSGTIKLSSQLTINNPLTIDGSGQTIIISGESVDRVFCVPGSTPLTLNTLTITNGKPSSACNGDSASGGGLYSLGALSVVNSTFSSNSALSGYGGGILCTGQVTVINSTFSSNSAGFDGGGINTYPQITVTNSTFASNSTLGDGGGILTNGAVTVSNSTFSDNKAYGTGSGGAGIFTNGAVTVTNSTFANNLATAGTSSAGIVSGGAVMVTNSTFANNSAPSGHAGAIYSLGKVTITNTIITKSTASLGAFACGGGPATSTNSLIDDSTCGTSLGTVTGLGTLANNGGPTQTMALLAGSNAIDAVPAGQCTVATDQRGYGRPAGALCDIGAYEYGAVAPAPASLSSGGAVTYGPVLQSCYQPNGSLVSSVKINVPSVTANGVAASIFCQILTDPSQYNVTNQAVTLAIDVFALTAGGQSVTAFSTPVQVCLQGSGALLFRDATGAPRVTVSLQAISNGGYTCGSIPNAGTVILIAGAALSAGALDGSAAAVSHTLTGCLVTTLYGLNIHRAPDINSDAVGSGVAANVTLSTTDRAGDWVKVTYGAVTGWLLISNDLSLSLNCN